MIAADYFERADELEREQPRKVPVTRAIQPEGLPPDQDGVLPLPLV
jgi:hypothetical protein